MGQSGPENGTDDEDLVRRIGAGEAEALAAFYDHHAPRALGIITRVLGPGPEAEDALQETFTQVWLQAGRYDPKRATPLVWLLMIARSRALDQARRHASWRPLDVISPTVAPLVEFDLERSEEARIVRQALERLPGTQRDALTLAFFQGMSHSEIARHQGVSLGTAKSRVRLGLNRLRDLIKGANGESPS